MVLTRRYWHWGDAGSSLDIFGSRMSSRINLSCTGMPNKKWAVVQSCVNDGFIPHDKYNNELSKFHLPSKFASRFKLEKNKYIIVPVTSIVDQCLGLINHIPFPKKKGKDYDDTAIVIDTPDLWEKHYLSLQG